MKKLGGFMLTNLSSVERVKYYVKESTLGQVMRAEPEIIFSKQYLMDYFSVGERQVRRAFSELRKEGIYYFSIGKDMYQFYGGEEQDQLVEAYALNIIKSIETQYYNDLMSIKPLLKTIQARRKSEKMERVMKKLGQISFSSLGQEETNE